MVAHVKLRRSDYVLANGNLDLLFYLISSGIKTEGKVVLYNLKHYLSLPSVNIKHIC